VCIWWHFRSGFLRERGPELYELGGHGTSVYYNCLLLATGRNQQVYAKGQRLGITTTIESRYFIFTFMSSLFFFFWLQLFILFFIRELARWPSSFSWRFPASSPPINHHHSPGRQVSRYVTHLCFPTNLLSA
jgi:hypothetical protein